MLNKIRKKLFGERYVDLENKIKGYKKKVDILISLLDEVKAERNELKMELAEAYTYMAELKAKAEDKGE